MSPSATFAERTGRPLCAKDLPRGKFGGTEQKEADDKKWLTE
jgi:hypothetical protein